LQNKTRVACGDVMLEQGSKDASEDIAFFVDDFTWNCSQMMMINLKTSEIDEMPD
jgi:hypothetical protein